MTKKDYEALAGAIRKSGAYRGIDTQTEVINLVARIADVLEMDNERFDRLRFLAACKGEDSTDSAGRRVRYSVQS